MEDKQLVCTERSCSSILLADTDTDTAHVHEHNRAGPFRSSPPNHTLNFWENTADSLYESFRDAQVDSACWKYLLSPETYPFLGFPYLLHSPSNGWTFANLRCAIIVRRNNHEILSIGYISPVTFKFKSPLGITSQRPSLPRNVSGATRRRHDNQGREGSYLQYVCLAMSLGQFSRCQRCLLIVSRGSNKICSLLLHAAQKYGVSADFDSRRFINRRRQHKNSHLQLHLPRAPFKFPVFWL